MTLKNNIIIVGSGPVGMLCAISAKMRGINTKIITKSIPKNTNKLYSLNCTTINYLKTLNINMQLSDKGKILQILVSDTNAQMIFDESNSVSLPMSYVISSDYLIDILSKKIKEMKINVIKNCEIISIENNQGKQTITYKNENKTITDEASMILGCDGIHSITRDKLGIERIIKNYHQTAYSYICHHKNQYKKMAYEIFLPNGDILAMLPISNKTSAVIFNTYDDSDKMVYEHIKHIDIILDGPMELKSKYPIYGMMVENIYKDNVILMGSASCNLHPVAGQGLNLGIRDIANLFEIIDEYMENGINITNPYLYEKFSQKRYKDQLGLWHSTNAMMIAFKSKFLKFPRMAFLKIANHITFIKNKFTYNGIGAPFMKKYIN